MPCKYGKKIKEDYVTRRELVEILLELSREMEFGVECPFERIAFKLLSKMKG